MYRRSTLEQWSDAWRSKVDLADHFETQIAAKKAALKLKAPEGRTAERQQALLETFRTLLAADRDRLLREEPEVAHAVPKHKDFVSNASEREYPQELQEIRDSEEALAVLREDFPDAIKRPLCPTFHTNGVLWDFLRHLANIFARSHCWAIFLFECHK